MKAFVTRYGPDGLQKAELPPPPTGPLDVLDANGASINPLDKFKMLAGLSDTGTLDPVLDRTFAFDDTLEVLAYVEQDTPTGRNVVTR